MSENRLAKVSSQVSRVRPANMLRRPLTGSRPRPIGSGFSAARSQPSCAPRRRRGESREIGKAERAFDSRDLLEREIEAVAAEFAPLDLLETIAELGIVPLAERGLERGEDDRVLTRGMGFVHAREGEQSRGQRRRVAGSNGA